MARSVLGVVSVAFLTILAGCGGNGGASGGEPQAGQTVSVGTLQVGVASAAAFKTLTLTSPGTSRIAFTVLYGTKIVRLEEMGYGKIAFDRFVVRDANWEVYVMNADGSGQTNLTNNAADDEWPSWSPDGRKIAFTSDRNLGNAEIYVMNADGSNPTNLTNNVGVDVEPAWSPDGSKIAFVSTRGGEQDIYVMNANGSGQTALTETTEFEYEPTWSPDGRMIAFESSSGGGDICTMNADGSGQINLTNNPAWDEAPAWSPDGSRIAFYSDRDGPFEIYVMGPDGRSPFNLTAGPFGAYSPAWSPDGSKIAFMCLADYCKDIYVMNADGSGQTNLTKDCAGSYDPAWCPALSVVRSLIGAAGSDGGQNPPFGTNRPLAIVGLNADGLVSATTVWLNPSEWPSLKVAALKGIGSDLVGVEITGNNIRQVVEDMGRGLPTRIWQVYGTPTTGAVLVFFSGATGKVSSIIAGSDTALADTPAQLSGARVIVRGSFNEVYSAKDAGRNLVSGSAKQVALDSHTGEVIAVN
jgi:Tol biopolymer transport system component